MARSRDFADCECFVRKATRRAYARLIRKYASRNWRLTLFSGSSRRWLLHRSPSQAGYSRWSEPISLRLDFESWTDGSSRLGVGVRALAVRAMNLEFELAIFLPG